MTAFLYQRSVIMPFATHPGARGLPAVHDRGTAARRVSYKEMALAIGWMLAGAVLAMLSFMLTHRRRTPYLHLQLDELQPLHDGLQALAGLTGGAVYEGNGASVLQNGALFPAMEADIEAARHTVHLETFVWTAGEVERRFVELFCRKAQQGVKVRLLID